MLGMGQATKLAGLSKATRSLPVIRHKVSATKRANGGNEVDQAEISQAHPSATDSGAAAIAAMKQLLAVADRLAEIDVALTRLEEERPGLKAQIDALKEQIPEPKQSRAKRFEGRFASLDRYLEKHFASVDDSLDEKGGLKLAERA